MYSIYAFISNITFYDNYNTKTYKCIIGRVVRTINILLMMRSDNYLKKKKTKFR